MANRPPSSITTTAGSFSFPSRSGATSLTTMPVAMMKTNPSVSGQSDRTRPDSSPVNP